MNLPAHLLPSDLLWLSNFIFAILLIRALWYAPWRSLNDSAARSNALVALTMGAFFIWQLSPGVHPGLHHHLIGATLFVLMFGWQIALSALSLVLAGSIWYANADPLAFGINGLVLIAVPVYFSEMLLRFSQRNLPHHFMLFVLGNGFFCALVSMLLVVLTTTLVLAAFSHYSLAYLGENYLLFTLAIMFAEGFITGMLTTAFVSFSPDAVVNFRDEDYLNGK